MPKHLRLECGGFGCRFEHPKGAILTGEPANGGHIGEEPDNHEFGDRRPALDACAAVVDGEGESL